MRDIIEKHLLDAWPRLFGYALSLAADQDEARDLLQQCALHALGTRHPPQNAAYVHAWLFKILRNIWIDRHRLAARQSITDAPPPELEGLWRFDDQLIVGLTIRQALAALELPQREIIELIDIAGFSYGEASEILAVPIGTVMSRLSRARLALFQAIEAGNLRPLNRKRRRVP